MHECMDVWCFGSKSSKQVQMIPKCVRHFPVSLILMGCAVYAECPLLQAYLADSATPAMRDNAFGLYFALAFGVGSVWSGILGWMIDRFGFGAAFWTMAATYIIAGLLLTLLPRESEGTYTSTDMATAPPPPRQRVASPRPPPRRRSS